MLARSSLLIDRFGVNAAHGIRNVDGGKKTVHLEGKRPTGHSKMSLPVSNYGVLGERILWPAGFVALQRMPGEDTDDTYVFMCSDKSHAHVVGDKILWVLRMRADMQELRSFGHSVPVFDSTVTLLGLDWRLLH